jgi:multidrug efflux pump subunit AcrA (membrane-fusion protein)
MIEDIRINGSRRALTIEAPMDGIVASIGSSSGGGGGGGGISGGMSGMSGMGASGGSGGMNDMSSGMGGDIKEGDYVGSGTAVFSIADLSSVWVFAHVYEDELQFVSEGLTAELELDYLPGQFFNGSIDFVYPFLDRQTRDIKIRMDFLNPDGLLMPGMFGTVRITNRIEDTGLLIPAEAVIHSGDRRVVFLALSGGRFAPQEVTLGVNAGDNMVQILDGLAAGQTIVTSAQFLLDSESRLKEALNKMLAGASIEIDNEHEGMGAEEWADLAPNDPDAHFRCPMPGDRFYTSDNGECPICGMFLEPHDPEEWAAEHQNAEEHNH